VSKVEIDIITYSAEETVSEGRRIGQALHGGEVIGLYGPLGAGKTHLVKGIADGLGAGHEETVNSPTFVLVNEYSGRLRLYHVDAYRLDSPADLERIGFEELPGADSVVVVEWADRVESVFNRLGAIRIFLSYSPGGGRRISNRP
jgi:tRNA threonylcarbamoyladenosine biosynthesis protein TsaE